MLPKLPDEDLLELFRQMWLIRRFEERLIRLAHEGESFGHYHVYIGQESIGIPVLTTLRPDDLVFTTHRNHGHLLGRGADPGRLLAEILGKSTGLNGGKGGTLHACAPELGVLHTSAAVGGGVPIAAGAALAAKRRKSNQVTMAFFGDGALEEGAVFETLNLAALWQLPVVFLCENNASEAIGAAAGGYPGSVIAASELGAIAESVGVASVTVDGTDAGAVLDVALEAVASARAGDGPTFVDAVVARWPGSNPLWPELPAGETELRFAWEPETAPPELARWYREQDGVLRYVRELLDGGVTDRRTLEAVDEATRDILAASIEFALGSAYPDAAAAITDAFALAEPIGEAPDERAGRELTYAEALVEAIYELMEEDEDFLLIGSYVLGIGPWRHHFDRIRADHGDQVLDPPTAELAFSGAGTGAAMTGLRTMVDVGTASFVFQAFAQVVNEAANAISMSGGRLRVPVVFHLIHGLRGGGAAQHSHSPQAMLWNTPGLQIILPSTPRDVKGLLRRAFSTGSPTIFIDHSKLMLHRGMVPEGGYEIPFGVAEVRRAGRDVTIVATSHAVHDALAAAAQVIAEGVDVEVVDPRTLVPLDRGAILSSVGRTGRLVVVDEGHLSCGVASEIAALVAEEGFDSLLAPIRRVTVPDVPVPFSPVLEQELAPTAKRIADAVRTLVGTRAAV